MAVTQAQIDFMKDMIAQGVIEETFDGKTIKYASLADLIKAVKYLEGDMNNAAGSGAPRSFIKHTRG